MSLVNSIRRNAPTMFKATTVAGFTTLSDGHEYLRNGYYGIYRAAYGLLPNERALTTAALFGGAKIISEDIGSLSLVTRRWKKSDESEPYYEHPQYSLWHDSPNPDQTAMEFREQLTAQALLSGRGYAKIEWRAGQMRALWPWQSEKVQCDKDQRGRPVFIYEGKTYSAVEVFILNGFGLTGQGANLMEVAKRTLGLTTTLDEYAGSFFSRDQTPNIILEHPGKPGPVGVQGIKDAWAKGGGWHEPRVTSEGMKVTQLHPDAQKSQLIEQRAYQLLEVCRFLRLSPHKLADMSKATWANVEQLNINHYNETLRPWCERWEQAIKLRCLRDEPRVYVKHNIASLLRGDFKAQTEGFAKLLDKGVFCVNDVLKLLDMNPVEGGDKRFIQLNMQELTAAADAAAGLDAPGGIQ